MSPGRLDIEERRRVVVAARQIAARTLARWPFRVLPSRAVRSAWITAGVEPARSLHGTCTSRVHQISLPSPTPQSAITPSSIFVQTPFFRHCHGPTRVYLWW